MTKSKSDQRGGKRKGAGRPNLPLEDRKVTTVTKAISMPIALAATIAANAETEGKSFSGYLCDLAIAQLTE